jgi:long-chain acyl-CoA synthetase
MPLTAGRADAAEPGIAQPFRDGWLLTGDLGHMQGSSLVLDGRKKDMIITSYGKNINPGKIEALLKGIPGVVEAMVIGEGRPFCSALLWGNVPQPAAASGIAEMNGRLSHPEQIKEWKVLSNDLSMGKELTGNLKLKRDVVTRRFAPEIEGMYGARPRGAEPVRESA